jgi:hypothetical protein
MEKLRRTPFGFGIYEAPSNLAWSELVWMVPARLGALMFAVGPKCHDLSTLEAIASRYGHKLGGFSVVRSNLNDLVYQLECVNLLSDKTCNAFALRAVIGLKPKRITINSLVIVSRQCIFYREMP